mmetsp:Transcript_70821/g.129098  ORF Transcript_70821/g.129098 Transcript_70821/m.129098 type:complete len:113 (-) Transcript_70821:1457-1795(-)
MEVLDYSVQKLALFKITLMVAFASDSYQERLCEKSAGKIRRHPSQEWWRAQQHEEEQCACSDAPLHRALHHSFGKCLEEKHSGEQLHHERPDRRSPEAPEEVLYHALVAIRQ